MTKLCTLLLSLVINLAYVTEIRSLKPSPMFTMFHSHFGKRWSYSTGSIYENREETELMGVKNSWGASANGCLRLCFALVASFYYKI